jgi:hypothetical protein
MRPDPMIPKPTLKLLLPALSRVSRQGIDRPD